MGQALESPPATDRDPRQSGFRERIPTLVDPVEAPSPAPRRDRPVLTVLSGPAAGAVVPVRDGMTIGRGDHAALRLDEPTLSWSHARIVVRDGVLVLEDLASTNGTMVQGERVARAALNDGDRICFGPRVVVKLSYQDALEERAARQLWESSIRDPLTGAHNRRYLEERLAAEFSYALRHGEPLTVMLADIDHFKRVNDRCGHAVGDAVLRVVATSIRRVLRPEDVLARYGGEEFVVLARGVDARNAVIMAERIRRRVQGLPLPADVAIGPLTVSVGVATMQPERPHASASELVEAADRAMYAAKSAGRNRVMVA